MHLAMASVSCSFNSFSIFLLRLKQQQNLMKIMFSCIHFPIWPYPPQNNEKLYTGKLYGLTGMKNTSVNDIDKISIISLVVPLELVYYFQFTVSVTLKDIKIKITVTPVLFTYLMQCGSYKFRHHVVHVRVQWMVEIPQHTHYYT